MTGRVVVAGDSTPVPDQHVVLHRVTADSGFAVDSVATDEAGRFEFRLEVPSPGGASTGPPGGGEDGAAVRAVHLVSTRYDGVLYFGPAAHGGEVPEPYRVVVHPARAASGSEGLRVRRRTLVVAPHRAGVRVLDAVDLAAAGEAALVGPAAGEAWWSLALPEGASDPEVLPGGIDAESVSFGEGRVSGGAAVPPSGRRLVVGYGLEGRRLRLGLERPVEHLEVVLRGEGLDVEAPGLERTAGAGEPGTVRFVGRSLEAGERVELTWRRTGDRRGWLGWGLLGLGLILGAGAVLAWRRDAGLGVGALLAVAGALSLAAPGPVDAEVRVGADTMVVSDDRGGEVTLAAPPRRIVSLVPALTEVLFALDAGDRLVGRTKYGVHPPEARRVPSVGEGIRPSAELVTSRDPDLVLAYAGAENRATLEQFARLGIPALAVRHDTFEDLYRNVQRLGRLTGRRGRAERLTGTIRCRLEAVSRAVSGTRRKRVYYEVWGRPPVTVGDGSYLDSLVTVAGGINVFGEMSSPSPRVSLEAIVERRPEVVILAEQDRGSGRVPPADRPGWGAVEAVRSGAVRRVDGDLVHRLGPRVGDAAVELAAAIHPDLEEAVREATQGCARADAPGRARSSGGAGPAPVGGTVDPGPADSAREARRAEG